MLEGPARFSLYYPAPGTPLRPRDKNVRTSAKLRRDGGPLLLQPTLRDYGLIGNLHTAALVSRHGSVDWACLPRFASPSVFGRLLDETRGGFLSVAPAERYRSRQRYVPATCVLSTEFHLADGRRLEVHDFMPVRDRAGPEGTPLIVRCLRAYGGAVPVVIDCRPAFDYGRRSHTWRIGATAAVARSEEESVELRAPGRLEREGPNVRSRFDLAVGRRASVELAWGRRPRDLPAPESLYETTERFWRSWAHSPRSPVHRVARRWHRWVLRSELTLKLLSHADTGAFVAAPTTSLPESPGGVRNWDYRYVWIRDAAFAAQTLLNLGHLAEARAFLRWVLLRLRDDSSHRLRVVYGAHGETDLRERELRHWSGLWGSRPVRVGNGAAQQFQLDIYGELLDAALFLDSVDGEFVAEHWPELTGVAEVVLRRWKEPDRGIWEVRGPPQQFVHSKLMAWVALDRAAKLAEEHGPSSVHERWTNEAQKVRAWILADGFDAARGSFRRSAEDPGCDAANLRIPLVGFLPFDDPAVLGTIERVASELATGPFVYRYRSDDGLPGEEGTFLPASFWLVECLARAGEVERARTNWDGVISSGNPLDLFSEEYRPASKQMLGNFPQALTHVALLRAAVALGEATSRADESEAIAEPEPAGILPAIR